MYFYMLIILQRENVEMLPVPRYDFIIKTFFLNYTFGEVQKP